MLGLLEELGALGLLEAAGALDELLPGVFDDTADREPPWLEEAGAELPALLEPGAEDGLEELRQTVEEIPDNGALSSPAELIP